MPAHDLLQMKRKLKHPHIRRWYHEGGDDTYNQVKATKSKLYLLSLHEKTAKGKKQDWNVAFKGKEWGSAASFLRDNPSFKLTQKQQAALRRKYNPKRDKLKKPRRKR